MTEQEFFDRWRSFAQGVAVKAWADRRSIVYDRHDAIQDGLVGLWKLATRQDRLDPARPVEPYLTVVVRFAVINGSVLGHQRTHHRCPTVAATDADWDLDGAPGRRGCPLAEALADAPDDVREWVDRVIVRRGRQDSGPALRKNRLKVKNRVRAWYDAHWGPP